MKDKDVYDDLPQRIAVVARDNRFLSYTHPARVRKLLKQGKAEVFSQNPFTIKLKGERGAKMQPKVITNFTEYFKGEERDVYLQNVSNTQVSLQFETSPGRFESVLIPRTRQPFNLTQHIPFETIKICIDLRKLVNRRPPALRLMTSEEFEEFYKNLAKQRGTTLDEEVNKALELQASLMNKTAFIAKETEKVKTFDELQQEREANPDEFAEDQPHPRVIGVCAQVGPDVDKDHKMDASSMLNDLEALEGELKEADFDYVVSHGYYKTVKKWANERLSEVAPEEE